MKTPLSALALLNLLCAAAALGIEMEARQASQHPLLVASAR